MKSFYKINQPEDFYTVIANITSRCNFCCEYCCEFCNLQHNTEDMKLSSLELFITSILSSIEASKRSIKLSIYGGEPTLHPDMFELCNKLKTAYAERIYIEVYSNFSAAASLYNELMNIGVNLILTAHDSRTFSMASFYSKVLELDSRNIASRAIFNVMFEKQHIKTSIELYHKLCAYFKSTNIVMKLPPLLKKVRLTDSYAHEYAQDELDMFDKIQDESNVFFVKQYALNDNDKILLFTDSDLEKRNMCFKSWLCYSGYSSCYVHVDGNIYRCQSDFYSKTNTKFSVYGKYDFDQIAKPHICNASLCTDYDSKKVKIFDRS